MSAIDWAEQGRVPDFLIRWSIRRRLTRKLRFEQDRSRQESLDDFVRELDQSPIAVETAKANEQHYEVPSAYFDLVLGRHRKYSGTYWPNGVETLDGSEQAMLELTAERAAIENGHDILELGCGWGSFSLWAAEHFPRSRVVGVSNSHSQRTYIMDQAAQRGLRNLEIRTADMNTFDPGELFDRVVSIEMFEHMKNYRELMRRIASWLRPGGKLFVHIFTHDRFAYHYEDEGGDRDWMTRYFFSGGTMPSADLLPRFQDDLALDEQWRVDGTHYSRTLEAWLARHDLHERSIRQLFEQVYGDSASAKTWFHRWRLFYLACSELFRFRDGQEWAVSHYRFSK